MQTNDADDSVNKLDTLEEKIKAKKKLSENDYLLLTIISLSRNQIKFSEQQLNIDNKFVTILREIFKIVVFLFIIAWFRTEITQILDFLNYNISTYIKYALGGFHKLSFGDQYQILVITLPSIVITAIITYHFSKRK